MKAFKAIFSIFRHLSMDVVLGAVASGSMVVYVLGKPMPWIWWVALPIAVWVIYTADHLMDAYRLQGEAHTPRHLFHHTYFKPIGIIWLLLLLSCMSWIAYLVPTNMLYLGFLMGLLVVLHLALVSLIGSHTSWLLHKELGVGLIYALGIWGGPAVVHQAWQEAQFLLLFTQFFLLAMINLLFFSLYEIDTDKWDGHTSAVLALGKKATLAIISMFAILIIGIGIFLLNGENSFDSFHKTQIIYALMLICLLAISFFPTFFGKNERYRYLGDGAFLLPALIWLW